MRKRTILHSDLNCFYASVEMMLNPSLQGKAVAVCGTTEDRHRIVLAKSEPAKKAGVKTEMVNWEAQRLCPNFIMVPPQYEQYLKDSKLIRAIYQRFTDRVEVWPLPGSDLLYVGRATNAKLANYGIHTIGDIAGADSQFLRRLLGVNGLELWKYAAGKDDARVMHKDFVSTVKSVGHGITCYSDLETSEEVWKVMLELLQDIGHKLRVHELAATGVQISIRGNDLFGKQYQSKLSQSTQSPMVLARKAHELFEMNYRWSTSVRAVCVRAISLVPVAYLEKMNKLDLAIEEIRRRFGKRAAYWACLMGDLKIPGNGRCSVTMPGMMYK